MDLKTSKPWKRSTCLLSVGILVLLVLISSCSIQKAVYSYFGATHSKPLNANKTILTNSNACFTELSRQQTTVDVLKEVRDFCLPSPAKFSYSLFVLNQTPDVKIMKISGRSVPLPYYILYRELKVYS